jgi:hypothetical protein
MINKIVGVISIIFGILVFYTNCSKSNNNQTDLVNTQENNVNFYFKSMKLLTVDVFYEPGAEPYVGNNANGKAYWDLLKDNLSAIFQGRAVSFSVPKTLSEMTLLPLQNKSVWSAIEVAQLESSFGRPASTDEARFSIFFLNGNVDGGSGSVNLNTLGFQVTGTRAIAIFKNVIRSTGVNPNGPVPRYVEQSTLVHELGHALGFVNNGLPLTSAHHDSANGAHCTNANCVMHYLNEGKSDLTSFVQNYISTGSTVMFQSECLQDARSY